MAASALSSPAKRLKKRRAARASVLDGAPPPSQQPAPAGYAPGPQADGAYAPVRGLARSQNPPYAGHQPY